MVARFRFALTASAALAFAVALPALGLTQAVQGQQAQDQPAAAASGGGVAVMKGNPPPKAAPADDAPAAEALQPGEGIMMDSGGRHMWMVDRANGQVTDCQSRETSTPGQPAIDCATRPLPVPSR
jgi:hypothetical protein